MSFPRKRRNLLPGLGWSQETGRGDSSRPQRLEAGPQPTPTASTAVLRDPPSSGAVPDLIKEVEQLTGVWSRDRREGLLWAFSLGLRGSRGLSLSPEAAVCCEKSPHPPWPVCALSPGLSRHTGSESLFGEPEPTWGSETLKKRTSQHFGKGPGRTVRGGTPTSRGWGEGSVHGVSPFPPWA